MKPKLNSNFNRNTPASISTLVHSRHKKPLLDLMARNRSLLLFEDISRTLLGFVVHGLHA